MTITVSGEVRSSETCRTLLLLIGELMTHASSTAIVTGIYNWAPGSSRLLNNAAWTSAATPQVVTVPTAPASRRNSRERQEGPLTSIRKQKSFAWPWSFPLIEPAQVRKHAFQL